MPALHRADLLDRRLTPRLAVLASFLLAGASFAQSTWHVDVNGVPPGTGSPGDPYTSIQYAINQPTTLHLDTLLVAPGTYVENIRDFDGVAFEAVLVRSTQGPLSTFLRPALPNQPAVEWARGSMLEGFTITGGGSPSFGVASILGGTLQRCIVRDNVGIGVFSDGGTVRACSLVDNGIGLAIEFFGGLSMRDTLVWSNTTDVLLGGTPVSIDFCAGGLPAGAVGQGNLIGDPQVWEAPGFRHFLQPGSVCVDAGDPSSPLDPDGTRADIGAIPFEPAFAPPATVYCQSKANSLGCLPAIGSLGNASASGSPFTVTCAGVLNNKNGLLFYGFGVNNSPLLGGTLCVTPPITRTSLQFSAGSTGADDCSGTFVFDMDAHIQGGADPLLAAGALVCAEYWSRDPNDGFGSSLSDALFFGIAP